jgi:NhaP-type Na+/H+ or K+/H+ antiporter
VLWFSGLRGIISFALALNVPGADHDIIAAATLIIVMATIIIFGGGTVPLLTGPSTRNTKHETLNPRTGLNMIQETIEGLGFRV